LTISHASSTSILKHPICHFDVDSHFTRQHELTGFRSPILIEGAFGDQQCLSRVVEGPDLCWKNGLLVDDDCYRNSPSGGIRLDHLSSLENGPREIFFTRVNISSVPLVDPKSLGGKHK